MKNILFKKSINPEKRMKAMVVAQTNEDADCVSKVRKSFLYSVKKSGQIHLPQLETSDIYIVKFNDTKKGIEKFRFQVKGKFTITHQEELYDVYFQHTLKITMFWKIKSHSFDKKSEILT